MPITSIMLDSNESAVAPWTNKLSFGGVPKIVTNLEWGDIIASTDDGQIVVIERKTGSDLLNSIKDKHIFAQANGMRKLSPWSYLVICDVLAPTKDGKVIADNRVTGWRWESMQGALLDIQDLGVKIVYCTSNTEYEPTVIRLCNRERSNEKIIEPTIQSRIMSPGEAILCSLPGIAWERASKLLDEFDNDVGQALAWLTWVGYTTTSVNTDIAGIGIGIKRGVRKALNIREGYVLDVLPDEKTLQEALKKEVKRGEANEPERVLA